MDQLPVKATIPLIATRFSQRKKASYSYCLRRHDVFYNLNERLGAIGKFSELDDHSFFSSALVQSARHHGLSPVAEPQIPKLHVRTLTKVVIYRNADKTAWKSIAKEHEGEVSRCS
jgi:hypothetical protein